MIPGMRRVIAATGVAGALLSAGVACAGQAPDTAPPGTVTLGPLRLTPSLLIKDMGVDDNVFYNAVNPKRDYTVTVTPRADVAFRMRRLRLGYSTSTEYVYYRTYRSERGINTTSVARMDVDLGYLKPYATIQGVNTRARLNSEVDARARHRDLLYGAGIALKIASRTNLLVNGTQGRVVYDPDTEKFRGVDLRQTFDGRRRSIDVGIGIALTPLTTFTLAVAREQQRFARSSDRDSNTWRVSPTLTFSPSGLLTGSATVGYRRFQTVSSSLPDFSGLVSLVNIGATIYTRHQVDARFSRDVQYSYDVAAAYYLTTGGTITWTYLLAGPIDVRGSAGRTLNDYTVAGALGHEQLTTYGVGVGYRFSTRARLGVNAEWTRRESAKSADRAFRDHKLFAGLTWGVTP
jgi:hypothetical protein